MNVAPIMADGTDDSTGKFIIGALVLIGWVVVQVIGAANKLRDKRKLPAPTNPRAPQRPATRPTPVLQRQPTKTMPKPRRPGAAPARPAAALSRPATTPLRPAPSPVARPPMLKSPQEADPSARPIAARARIDLMKPQNVRAAFILTELLRPPLALRTEDDAFGR